MKVKTILSSLIITVLIAAMALSFSSCGDNSATTTLPDNSQPIIQAVKDAELVGEGETEFSFRAVLGDENERLFSVQTDEKTVGEALEAVGLISGDDGEFGIYIKTVCGVTADYNTDGKYWAFYIDGEYAATGVDSTEIDTSCEYMLKLEDA